MATVIGVRFKKAGKVYYFDPNGFWPRPDDGVVVETMRGLEYGEVVTGQRTVDESQLTSPLKKVVRLATVEDIRRAETNERREKEAFKLCQERIARHNLDMKLVNVEFTFDNSRIIFYFTANGRVDFRELVKDLAGVFKTRIELRQIGVRDEAKMLGGLGACGRPICCRTFLSDFQPVSIKMAKEQNLSLNPTKISGQCGRLMCCLKYEQDNYDAVLKRVPRVGKDIVTPDGVGVITEINVIKETVRVRIRQ
ncbi:MAG: PSP1 domain-containing protein, partial [bacterium]